MKTKGEPAPSHSVKCFSYVKAAFVLFIGSLKLWSCQGHMMIS